MKTKAILNGIYLFLLAVITTAADSFYQGGWDSRPDLILKILVYLFLYALFFFLMEKALERMERQTKQKSWHRYFQFSAGNILRLSVFLFVVYFVYLLVYYPGTCGYDTVNQITDLVTGTDPMPFDWIRGQTEVSALMNDHHPVVTTLVFTLFYRLGLLLGDANRGMFLYNLIQTAVLAVLFAAIVCRMDRLAIPKPIALISVVFYVSPVIAYYAITMIKDTLFSLCFVLYYLVYAGIVTDTSDQGKHPRRSWVLLILLSILISLLNKKGMYLAGLSNFLLFFILRGKKKFLAVLAAALPCFTIVVLMGQILFPFLNIYPGGRQEALGFTFQQTALAMIEHPETYSEAEKEVFFSVLNLSQEQLAEAYDPTRFEPVKDTFRFETDNAQISAYLKLWAAHFFRTPITYIRALLSVCGGYFAPVKGFDIYTEVVYGEIIQAFRQPEGRSAARENMTQMFCCLQNLPVLRVFFRDSLYFFSFPAFCLYRLANAKQWRRLLVLAPIAANIIFLLVGPDCWTRYGLCQLYTFPVLLACIIRPGTRA